MKKVRLVIQILSIISIASFAGAMLMLYTSLVSFWEQIPPDDFLNWFSSYSSGITVTTGLLVKLSILFPLISIFITWKIPLSRNYWLIAYVFIIGIMVITFSFFIETNTAFVSKTIELAHVKASIKMWGDLHFIRTIMGFASSFFAVLGLVTYLSSTYSSLSKE